MHVKEDGEEEKYSEFLQEYTLRELVRKYSDYIRWPIRMHNHNPGGIELQAPLIVGAVVVIGRPGGDIQQRLVGHLALGGDGHHRLRGGEVAAWAWWTPPT